MPPVEQHHSTAATPHTLIVLNFPCSVGMLSFERTSYNRLDLHRGIFTGDRSLHYLSTYLPRRCRSPLPLNSPSHLLSRWLSQLTGGVPCPDLRCRSVARHGSVFARQQTLLLSSSHRQLEPLHPDAGSISSLLYITSRTSSARGPSPNRTVHFVASTGPGHATHMFLTLLWCVLPFPHGLAFRGVDQGLHSRFWFSPTFLSSAFHPHDSYALGGT